MFILTNDDGIDAPGIKALEQAIRDKPRAIVAPKDHLSGCGHQLTTWRPFTVEQRDKEAYAVDGTPADCTRVAITKLYPHTSYVLSGINAGGNLGVDVYTSGTVAAVREGAMHGLPGIAISHWIKKPLVIDWEQATRWARMVLEVLLAKPLDPGSFWNVNLPHLEPGSPEPDLIFCEPGCQPLPVNYRVEGNLYHYQGEYGQRPREPGTDVDVCFSGNIAVTLLKV